MTGIIGALDKEVDTLIAEMTGREQHDFGKLTVYVGRIAGCRVAVCRSGVGKVAAAMAATVLTAVFHVTELINTGVAGGTVPRGSMVLSDQLVQHDVRAYADNLPDGQLEGFDSPYLPADSDLLARLSQAAEAAGIQPIVGTIVSGDQFICDSAVVKRLKSEFNAKAVDMESAAIAQVCALTDIPFVAVRTITDNADEAAAENFYELVEAAAARSISVLHKYFSLK